jgi:hypothetical protein
LWNAELLAGLYIIFSEIGGDTEMAKYMLLLRGGNDEWANFTPEQAQEIMQKYYTWSSELNGDGKGKVLEGDALREGGRVLSVAADRSIVDGPYAETKESIGGYYVIEATDIDEAVEISRGCPTLLHGGVVEIREVNETPMAS